MGMKLSLCVLMALFFVTMPLYAQDQPNGGDRQAPSADEIVSRMQSKLKLTQDQVTAITPIIEKYSSKREDLRQSMEDGTADRDSLRSQMKELRAEETQELSQVLSADQMSQWKSMQSHHHGSGGGSWGGPGGGGGSGT